MGWMHDTLSWFEKDPVYRSYHQNALSFSLYYAFNENFVLPLSHDEVVHGKCSLITRQPGDYWRQFAGMRTLSLYQMTHAGGKLNFMGNEIAQFIEWRYYEGIQYFLTEQYESHAHIQKFIAAMNRFYNEHPALWQDAYTPEGFEWIDADNADQSVISFVRKGDNPKDDLVILINFDVNPHEEFRIGLPRPGYWREVINSDAIEFGGSGVTNEGTRFASQEQPWNMRDTSIELRLPPLAGLILAYDGPLPTKGKAERREATARPAAKKAPKAKKPAASKRAATKAEAAATSTASAAKAQPATKKAPKAKKAAATAKAPARAKKAGASKGTSAKAQPAAKGASKASSSTSTAARKATGGSSATGRGKAKG